MRSSVRLRQVVVPFVALGSLFFATGGAQATGHPTVVSLSATPATISATGHQLTLTGHVTNANSCLIEASISVAGLPIAIPCSAGTFAKNIALTGNTGGPRVITFTVTARSGQAHAARTISVRQLQAPTSVSQLASDNLSPAGIGATFLLHAMVINAKTCTWSSSPQLPHFSATIACASGVVTKRVTIPRNISRAGLTFTFELSVVGGDGKASTSTRVTQRFMNPFTESAPTEANPWHGLPTSLSCPTATFCMAVDSQGFSLTETNGVWSAPQEIVPGFHFGPNVVSCATSTFCVAAAQGAILVYNGITWTEIDSPGGPHVKSMSCPTVTFCAAVSWNGYVFGLSQGRWTSLGQQIFGDVTSISCTSATFCVGIVNAGRK